MTNISAVVPALPPTTAIQDPAARQFANVVRDAIRALTSTEYSLQSLTKALGQLDTLPASGGASAGVGTQTSVAEILKSEVYSALTRTIDRISVSSGAGVAAETTARVDSDQALVDTLNAMWAAIGVNNAVVQSGGSVAVNWTAGQASQWNTMQTEVFGTGGNTIRVALQEESNLRATLDGNVAGTWTVRVDANGNVAGIGLGVEGGPGGVTSQFVVNADKFAVVSNAGGTPVIPFAVGVSTVDFLGGTDWSKVAGVGRPADNATVGATFGVDIGGQITAANIGTYIANAAIQTAQIANLAVSQAKIANAAVGTAQIADLSVTTGKIVDLSVSTLKIQGDAVTVPVSSYVAGASNLTPTEGVEAENFNTVASATLISAKVPAGTPVHVSAGVRVAATYLIANQPRPTHIHAQLLNPSGTVIADGFFGYTYSTGGSSVTEYAHVTLVGASTGPGTYSLRVAVHWNLSGVSSSATKAEYKTIVAIGAKK